MGLLGGAAGLSPTLTHGASLTLLLAAICAAMSSEPSTQRLGHTTRSIALEG